MEIEKGVNRQKLCEKHPMNMKEMFDTKSKNYEWQNFTYETPAQYLSPPSNHPTNMNSGRLFGVKKNYLDELQAKKKKIPGPNKYQIQQVKKRPQSGKMDRGVKTIFTQEVENQSKKKNIPGPGAYFKRPKSAIQKNIVKWKENPRDHYLNEVQYLSVKTPGVGQYNLNTPKHVGGPFYKNEKNERKVKKQNEGKQNFYNVLMIPGTFEWHKNQSKKRDSNFFGRSNRQRKGEKKPGPNQYKINTNWSKKDNIMNTTSSKFYKSVYYH